MAWDDDKGNPWRPDKDKGPADLDAVVRDFQRKLSGWFGGGRGRGTGSSVNTGLIVSGVLLVLGVWVLTGVYTIDESERGIVLRFGAYQGLSPQGLGWHLPWPIETVEPVNTGETKRYPYQASMLTRDENLVNIDLVVQYRISDPQAYAFRMDNADTALAAVTASSIREVVGRNELDFVLTKGRAEVERATQKFLQATLDSYNAGITIYEVSLQSAGFPREVEGAVQDIAKAGADRDRRILEAQVYQNDILPRARGDAEQRRQDAEAYRARIVANAEGEADRFLQILAQYQKAPGVTRERLYIETLEAILKSSTKVLVDTEGGNNVLYLPLDQLLQRRNAAPSAQPAPPVPPLTNATPRSRDRETR